MRLIDADALLEVLRNTTVWCTGWIYSRKLANEVLKVAGESVKKIIEEAPTIEAEPVQHGRWVSDEADILFHCSKCGAQISTSWDYEDLQWDYCPDCGAKMDKEE